MRAQAPLWSFLTFTQNFGLEGGAFSHAWSLCIEEHFYLALPLLVLALTGRVRWRGGVVLALVQTFRPALWSRWVRAPLGAALLTGVCLGLAGPLCAQNKTLASSALVFPLISLGFAALVVLAMTDAGARVLGRMPGARWLAGVTYCVYLSHKLVIHAVHEVLAKHGMGAYHPATLLVSGACVLAVAAVLHLGVERPFLRLRERWARPPARQALAATA